MCPIDFYALKQAVEDYKKRRYEFRRLQREEENTNGRSKLHQETVGQSVGQKAERE